MCFEFTSEFTDQGWEGFLPAEELRRDPLFLHDGKLLIDVRAFVVVWLCRLCMDAGGRSRWWTSMRPPPPPRS